MTKKKKKRKREDEEKQEEEEAEVLSSVAGKAEVAKMVDGERQIASGNLGKTSQILYAVCGG